VHRRVYAAHTAAKSLLIVNADSGAVEHSISSAAVLKIIAETCSHYVILGGQPMHQGPSPRLVLVKHKGRYVVLSGLNCYARLHA
jgi:hypothetical protein